MSNHQARLFLDDLEAFHAHLSAEPYYNDKGYGVNSVRFHSHCPPEAAFAAADEMGILLQPELSHWNPKDAFSSPLAVVYYEKELREILREYANHPSFVMLTFGNELQADENGLDMARSLLLLCHELDSTRLYAFSSNAFYGEKGADKDSDFYTAAWFKDWPTSFHSDYQWFVPSSQRAMILPDGVRSIVAVLDSYAYLRNMGLILEFNCKKGRVFLSTLSLHKQDYPECRALLSSIYRYLASDDFRPAQDISYEELATWFR